MLLTGYICHCLFVFLNAGTKKDYYIVCHIKFHSRVLAFILIIKE